MGRRLVSVVVLALLLGSCDIANWHLNERSGSTAFDSIGGHNGTIEHVGLTGSAYRFNVGLSRSIVIVPHRDDLNPGTGTFAISARVQLAGLPVGTDWDVMRKGLSSTAGGDFKMEIYNIKNKGVSFCYFRDNAGHSTKLYGAPVPVDGAYHWMTCGRRVGRNGSRAIEMIVDGVTVSAATNVNNIFNTSRLTIGAKSDRGDPFHGFIDEARVSKG
jgi:hypothetical protein